MKIAQILRSLRKITINHAIPVYNINWFHKASFFDSVLGDNEITVVDVGARNVSVEELLPLQKHLRYIGFDADIDEVRRLNLKENKFKSSKFIHSFVGKKDSEVNFNIHYNGGESSVYPFTDYYNDWFRGGINDYVKERIKLRSNSLDELIDEDVDFIKLDTQGTEYEILENAKKCLSSAIMVESEVEFIEMYRGQKLAYKILEMMHELDFELLHLNRVYGQSNEFKGQSRGQIIFGDALFGVSRSKALTLSFTKKLKYLVLLLNYGHIDFAYDIYKNSDDLKSNIPQLKNYFERRNKQRKSTILLNTLIDKFVFILLIIRKTNGIRSDSDRSWPIR